MLKTRLLSLSLACTFLLPTTLIAGKKKKHKQKYGHSSLMKAAIPFGGVFGAVMLGKKAKKMKGGKMLMAAGLAAGAYMIYKNKKKKKHSKHGTYTQYAIRDHYNSEFEVVGAMNQKGITDFNLIIGIDASARQSAQVSKPHAMENGYFNEFQAAMQTFASTFARYDSDNIFPSYIFGDQQAHNHMIYDMSSRSHIPIDYPGHIDGLVGTDDVMAAYDDSFSPNGRKAVYPGNHPTNLIPIIKQGINIVKRTGQYHILVVFTYGSLGNQSPQQSMQTQTPYGYGTNQMHGGAYNQYGQGYHHQGHGSSAALMEHMRILAEAAHYPLSIIVVGLGDGPFNEMMYLDDQMESQGITRLFDNFQFVPFREVTGFHPNWGNQEIPQPQRAAFMVEALSEVPAQFQLIKQLGLLGPGYHHGNTGNKQSFMKDMFTKMNGYIKPIFSGHKHGTQLPPHYQGSHGSPYSQQNYQQQSYQNQGYQTYPNQGSYQPYQGGGGYHGQGYP
ncbi:MAG: hypothetical protein AB8G05_28010 [Oligoflexales bacterium]